VQARSGAVWTGWGAGAGGQPGCGLRPAAYFLSVGHAARPPTQSPKCVLWAAWRIRGRRVPASTTLGRGYPCFSSKLRRFCMEASCVMERELPWFVQDDRRGKRRKNALGCSPPEPRCRAWRTLDLASPIRHPQARFPPPHRPPQSNSARQLQDARDRACYRVGGFPSEWAGCQGAHDRGTRLAICPVICLATRLAPDQARDRTGLRSGSCRSPR